METQFSGLSVFWMQEDSVSHTNGNLATQKATSVRSGEVS